MMSQLSVNSDTLSDVLQGVRLKGAIFFELEAHAPWVEAAADGRLIAPILMPGVQHAVSYHVVTQGECWVTLEGLPPFHLIAGDIIVFPHGETHVIGSSPQLHVKPDLSKYERLAKLPLPLSAKIGEVGKGSVCGVVCGFLGCDIRPYNPLIATLPRAIHVRDRVGATRGWLNQFVHVAVAESRERRPGGSSILARLSELMFVEAVRRHLESLPAAEMGLLAGLRDDCIGKALAALHKQPARPWSLDDLAKEAGLSRSVFADRFANLVGKPAIQYLTQWRMQLAAGMLARGGKVTQVALDVGYESEAAFSRTFKKLTGHSPGSWKTRSGRLCDSVESEAGVAGQIASFERSA